MKLSIGMIVKNEEENLERCLSSLQPLMKAFPSELIIVDTGSTDNTVAIARRYTDKIYFHPWENDYSKMRNFTVNYAQGAWFFFIDADEELVECDPIIDFLLGEKSRRYNAASVKINSFYKTGDTRQFATASVARLFRRTEAFRFTGVIHEQPLFEPPLFMLDAVLVHHGYVVDNPELRERKLHLYEPILMQALEKNPLDVHFWYQLSRTYASYKNTQEALGPARKAYEIIKMQKLKPADYLYVYVNLSYLHLINENFEETIEITKEGLKIKEWVVDLWFYLAKAQAMVMKREEAIQSYKKYLYYTDHYDQFAVQDIRMISFTITNKEEAYLDLSILYHEIGRKPESIEELRKIESAEILHRAAAHGVALSMSLQDYGLLESFYKKIKAFADEGMIRNFYQVLEKFMLNQECGRQEVYRIFCDEETEYGILNRIRLSEDPEQTGTGLLDDLGRLALNEQGDYYGDIFYFIIKSQRSFDLIDLRLSEEKLNLFFQYLNTKYSDLSAVYYEYLQCHQRDDCTAEEMRINKILQRTVLMADSLEDQKYEWVLERYIENGIAYIRQIYNRNILASGSTHLLKNKEEAFFMYMELARLAGGSDEAAYVRNLKNALKAYPEMKKGIEILLKRMTDKLETGPAISDEMKAYAQIVKTNIKQLIDKKMYQEAGEIILSFEQIIPDDPDIERMKVYLESSGGKVC